MTYPPTLPPSNRSDATTMAGAHAEDHNTTSTALTALVAELGANPSGAYADVTTRLDALPQAALIFTARQFGAAGDGGTNDALGLQAALDAAEAATPFGRVVVELEGADYVTGTRLQMPTDVELRNGRIVSTVATASGGVIQFKSNASGWALRNLTLDVGPANTGLTAGTAFLNNVIYVSGTQHDGVIEDCTLIGSKNQSIDILGGAYNITIRRNKFSDIKGGVRVYEGARNIRVEANDFTRWHGIAVHINGSASAAPSGVAVVDNTFHDPSPYATTAGGFVARQSIVAIADPAAFIHDLTVTGNVIEGPGGAFSDANTTDSDTATGDQITLWYCENFIVSHNKSFRGGENGISIVRGVRNGIVAYNVAAFNDGHGIQIGRITNTARDVIVIGNVVYNNGRDIFNDQLPGSLAGIFMQDTKDCIVVGNHLFDDQATHTQEYGILFNDAVDTVYTGNSGYGNTIATTSTAGGTTTFKQYWDSTTLRVGNINATQPRIIIDGAVGQRRELRWQSRGLDRFRLYATSNTESGTKTVTNKALTANVATITTATAHGLTIGATVVIRDVDQKTAPAEDVFDGDWVVTSVPTSTTFTYELPPVPAKPDVASQADTGYAYTGTNVGSNLVLESYPDQGEGLLRRIFTVDRATGKVTFDNEVEFDGAVTGVVGATAPTVATKGAAQVLPQSSTALTAVTNLTAAVAANATTEVRFFLYYDGDATADLKVKPVVPAGATVDWWVNAGSTGLAAAGTGTGNFNYGDESTASLAVGAAGVGVKTVAVVTCRVITAGTAGNVTLQAAQNVSSATDVTIHARSQVVARREV